MQAQQSSGGSGSLPECECECIVCKLVAKGFSTYNFEEKRQIISTGRPTPALRNLTKQTKLYIRHFQIENYKHCEWLTGCDIKSLLFCWPCLLFSSERNLWNKNGFSDLNNLHKLIKRHGSSKSHIQAIIKEKTFGNIGNYSRTYIIFVWDFKKLSPPPPPRRACAYCF